MELSNLVCTFGETEAVTDVTTPQLSPTTHHDRITLQEACNTAKRQEDALRIPGAQCRMTHTRPAEHLARLEAEASGMRSVCLASSALFGFCAWS